MVAPPPSHAYSFKGVHVPVPKSRCDKLRKRNPMKTRAARVPNETYSIGVCAKIHPVVGVQQISKKFLSS